MINQLLFDIVFSVVLHHGLGMVNFALNKSANQSTTLYYSNFNWTADSAVDGNTNGSNPDNSRTCSATIPSTSWVNHTWELDIGFQISVNTITVYGRTDYVINQLDGVKLYVGNTSEPWRYSQEWRSDPSSNVQNIKYVFKLYNVIARFISLMRSADILTICEVTAEGECKTGDYGFNCNETCGYCLNGKNNCSTINGQCSGGCQAGWMGETCKSECKEGTYGINCSETCGYCLNGNNSCSKTKGQCSDDCQAGWAGEACKSECKAGTYGLNCSETCGYCLNGNSSCPKTNGQCSDGCQAGWTGETCKSECKAGTYGLNCREICGYCLNGNNSCPNTNGQCSDGCQAGWAGETCKSECKAGTYGLNCREICGYCLNGNNSCPKTNGQCSDGCQAGWTGETCKSECKEGTYGFRCLETCGYCLFGNNSCSKTNGQCSYGCQYGWTGQICKSECKAGTYGMNCRVICGYCLNGNNSCSKTYGQCSDGCQAGWMGETCKSECRIGTYGFNCNETCGYCLNESNSCPKTNGQCSSGCQAGWTGETCKSECRRGTYGYRCEETCGNCYKGTIHCSLTDGRCMEGCEAGWHGGICKLECKAGTYGFNCNETCGYCLNGNDNCSKTNGQCNGACAAEWTGDTCKSGTLGMVTPVNVGPSVGVVFGSSLAAEAVLTIVIFIVIMKCTRKRNSNETSTENVRTATHYANLVVGNPDAVCEINVRSKTEMDTTFSAIAEASLQRGTQIGETNSHSGVKKPDVPLYNIYDKLGDVTETTESAYAVIDHSFIDEQKVKTLENCSNYVETLLSLENALNSVEKKIRVLLDRKEKLLCKELERARANKLRDKRTRKDSTESDTDTNYTNVNDQRRDDLDHCGNFVQMLQSLEGERRILEENRKRLLEKKKSFCAKNLQKPPKMRHKDIPLNRMSPCKRDMK